MGQLQKFETAIKEAKSVKELFQIPDVRDRFVMNYQAVTGRKDGENRLEQERFAYLQIVAEKPELQKVDNFYHVSALIYAGTTGLSFRDNKLYVYPNGKGGLKVQSSPAGKREMFEMMPDIKEAPEAVIVYSGDHFVIDKMNHRVLEHSSTAKTVEKNVLENVRAVYQRLIYRDKTVKDVIVYQDDLIKAKNKSKAKSEGTPWIEWPLEMAKKTALNRAFRLYHHYPDNVVLYGPPVDGDDAEDTGYTDVTTMPDEPLQTTESGEVVDTTSGEVINPLPNTKEDAGSYI
jgi:recombinational DNA repair protein RecT